MSIISSNLKVREVINQVVNDPTYKQVSYVPKFSAHQIGLIILAYFGVFGSIALHLFTNIPIWFLYPIMIFSFFLAFTPLHDSTHRAVSSNNRLNDILGTISGFLLLPMSNAIGYRYLHLTHHRYVGDKDLDPDEPMVYIPTKYFPFGYLALFFPDLLWAYWTVFKGWKRTPASLRVNIILMIAGNFIFHLIFFLSPIGLEYFLLFFIPNRLGICYTAFAFAHTPHPEGLKWNDFPFSTTFKLTGNRFFLKSLFGQDHHAMHHFLPHIPWYKYYKAWDLANGTFRNQLIPEKGFFSKPDIQYKDDVKKNISVQKDSIKVQVSSIEVVAKNIKNFIFEPIDNTYYLPEFTAGSYINIHLPSGKTRAYSCVNPSFEKNKYQIAVKLEANGKGGSKEMHEQISEGDILEIGMPRNNFVLYENVKKYILISGGIGITPILSMAHRLTEIDKYFEFHICAKEKVEVPFTYELQNWTFAPNVEFYFDKNGKSSIDLDKILASPDDETLVYFCGPSGFNNWVLNTALSKGWNKNQLKKEVFSVDTNSSAPPKEFQLTLNKSGRTFTIAKDQTIIDVLQLNNVKVDYTCLQGTCGSCITEVVDGKVDHRDAVLSEEEKIENKKVCLCVSRAKEDGLTINL